MRYSVAVALLIGPLLLWSCADATPHQADAPYQDVNDLGGEVGPEVTDIQEVPPQDVAPGAVGEGVEERVRPVLVRFNHPDNIQLIGCMLSSARTCRSSFGGVEPEPRPRLGTMGACRAR